MEQDRPDVQQNMTLTINNVEEDFHVIVEIRRRLYRSRYMANQKNSGDQPLRPGDTL